MRGFTLVELLIVLTVISIFLGIVGFRYSKQDSISMDNEFKKLNHLLQYTFIRAFTESEDYLWVINEKSIEIKKEGKLVYSIKLPADLQLEAEQDTFLVSSHGFVSPNTLKLKDIRNNFTLSFKVSPLRGEFITEKQL